MKYSVLKGCSVALFCSLTLTSCFDWLFGEKIVPVGEIIEYDGYYQPTEYSLNNNELNYSNFMTTINPLGTKELLVVPVHFNDGPVWTTEMISNLNKAFFGASSDTGWESVASFYKKSSYGKLTIQGEVHQPLLIEDYSVSQGAYYGSSTSYSIAAGFYESVVKGRESNYQKYDTDKDGYLDSVVFIYSNPYGSNSYEQNAYWAWVTWFAGESNDPFRYTGPKYGDCAVNTFMWASYSFMNEAYPGQIDAHTYIHETGHLLGLDDYYPNANDSFNSNGSLDMMDYNILDHNVYSKMLSEWTYPYVINGKKQSVTIDLKPFESSGDCIIINDEWNGSPLDEYLAIEFYTPTGLNEKDGKNGYPGLDIETSVQGYTIPGIKIYHIDARVAKLNLKGKTGAEYLEFDSYISRQPNYDRDYYVIAASNNYARSYAPEARKTKLTHLLEATGSNSFLYGGVANNNTLFQTGDVFIPNSVFFNNGTKFNNGKSIGYKITINSINTIDLIARVTITKI